MKIIKKLSKIGIAMSLVFAFTLMCIQPLTSVLADGTYNVAITFEVANSSEVTLQAKNGNEDVAYNSEGSDLMGRRGDAESRIMFEDTYNNTEISGNAVKVVCTDNKHCTATVTVPSGHGVRIVTPGGTPFAFMLGNEEYGFGNDNIVGNTTLTVVNRDVEEFDGNAYLIWSCGNGTCYHLFEGITGEPMFIKASTIKADNDNTKTFDVHAQKKTFASKSDFESWQEAYKTNKNVSSINFSTLDTSEVIEHIDMRDYEEQAINDKACTREGKDREEFEHCVDEYVASKGIFTRRAGFQPVGEPYSENAYVSYGDRNFKITIYNDEYRGVTLGSLNDLQYYPAVWNDQFLRVESYDISGNDPDNASVIDTILLEPIINIKALAYNDFEIKSIEAMDVPANAVTVTKSGDEYKIKFASHFYDNVLFKVTTTDNKTYYFRINRLTIDARLDHDAQGNYFVSAYFYYDNRSSYSDYLITAKIVYKNGKSKIVTMENSKKIDDGLGNVTYAYEVDQEAITEGPKGKGLKIAAYAYSVSESEAKTVSKIYINVEKAGSTKTSYAGAFAESGKGMLINVEEEFR